MTPSPEIGRHPDGSIDFDFYRRMAARERHEALGRIGRRCAAAITTLIAIIVARSTRIRWSTRMPAR